VLVIPVRLRFGFLVISVRSRPTNFVIPAQAGIQFSCSAASGNSLDSRLRGNDGEERESRRRAEAGTNANSGIMFIAPECYSTRSSHRRLWASSAE
jgi:hypothetical protein